MTRAELIRAAAESGGLSHGEATLVVEAVIASLVNALGRGEQVELRGFGSFRLRSRRARTGRNPKTGTAVDVPARKVPYFRPGKALKALLVEEG